MVSQDKFPENLAKNTLMPNMLLLVDTKTEPFTLLENKKQTQTERGVSDINQCSNPANKCYKMKNVFLQEEIILFILYKYSFSQKVEFSSELHLAIYCYGYGYWLQPYHMYIGIIAFLHKAVQTVDNAVLPPSLMVFFAINFIIIVFILLH